MNFRQIIALVACLGIYFLMILPMLINEVRLRVSGNEAIAIVSEKHRPKTHKGEYRIGYSFTDHLGKKVVSGTGINTFYNRDYYVGKKIKVLYQAGNPNNSIPKDYSFRIFLSLGVTLLFSGCGAFYLVKRNS